MAKLDPLTPEMEQQIKLLPANQYDIYLIRRNLHALRDSMEAFTGSMELFTTEIRNSLIELKLNQFIEVPKNGDPEDLVSKRVSELTADLWKQHRSDRLRQHFFSSLKHYKKKIFITGGLLLLIIVQFEKNVHAGLSWLVENIFKILEAIFKFLT